MDRKAATWLPSARAATHSHVGRPRLGQLASLEVPELRSGTRADSDVDETAARHEYRPLSPSGPVAPRTRSFRPVRQPMNMNQPAGLNVHVPVGLHAVRLASQSSGGSPDQVFTGWSSARASAAITSSRSSASCRGGALTA